MDAELAEFLEEQKRQEQMLRDLGISDDDETAGEVEALPPEVESVAAEVESVEEEAPADQPISCLPALTPAPIVPNSVRIALSIGAEGKGMAHLKPAPIRSDSGREFQDFLTRIYATDSHGWLASFAAFQKEAGEKPTGADLAALLPEAEEVAADLLNIAKGCDWPRWTMTAAPEYFPILAAAFRQAIKQGLPLVPDFGQSCQAEIFQHAASELRTDGILDRIKARALASKSLPAAEQKIDERDAGRLAIHEKVAAMLRSNAIRLGK